MKKSFFNILSTFLFGLTIIVSGCKKMVEVDPPVNRIAQDNVYKDNITAVAVLTSLYSRIAGTSALAYGLPTISKLAGLSADELNLWTGADATHIAYFRNALSAPAVIASINSDKAGHEIWNACYPLIYTCNSAIEGLSSTNSLIPSVKQQLLGEAKFMRAFIYFYLVNIYGDLPLAIGTDPEVNRLLARSSRSSVYDLIISDLKESENLLSTAYLTANMVAYASVPERVRPTKWAATALLARVYLYNNDYINAEVEASVVINNTTLFGLSTLSDVFLKNNKEAIWQLQPITLGWNTEDARMFNLSGIPAGFSISTGKQVYLSNSVLSAFEPGDNRRVIWVDSFKASTINYYYPSKYKQATQDAAINSSSKIKEYRMVLRLAELYLIRAEARAQQNKIADAVGDLNTLRTRARAIPTAAIPDPLSEIQASISQQQLLKVILHERQVELFCEWGHRWFDLKRTGLVNVVMSAITPQKGGSWETTDQLYPIPYSDIEKNPNLAGHQNPGY